MSSISSVAQMIPLVLAELILLIGVQIFLYGFRIIAVTAAVDDLLHGRPTSFGAVLSRTRPHLLRTGWTTLLVSIPVLGGAVCCIAPGVALMVVLAFAVPLVYLEGLWGPSAMKRSVELVTGRGPSGFNADANWARVFVTGFIMLAALYSLTILTQAPIIATGVVQELRGHTVYQTALGPEFAPLWILLPLQLLGAIAQGTVAPIAIIPWPLLYFDVRTRHEGYDLEMDVQRMIASRGGAAASAEA